MDEIKLYPVAATGLSAYCSDLITDPENEEDLYFISLTGYQGTVKGIVANFLEYYGISLSMNWKEHYYGRTSVSYEVLLKKLPSGLVHCIVLPKLALPYHDEDRKNKFFIFTNEKEDKPLSLFFRHLDDKTEIPIHPSWAEWLWMRFLELQWLIELKTVIGTFRGYSVEWNQTQLHDIISKALKTKDSEIIDCLDSRPSLEVIG